MKYILMLSTLMLLGWVSNLPGQDTLQVPTEIASPTSSLPLPPMQEQTKQDSTKRSVLKDAQQRDTQRKQAGISRLGSSAGSSQQYQQRRDANQQPMMPIAPTETSPQGQAGQYYQFLPPTAGGSSSAETTSGGRPSGIFGPMNVPNSPTRARPDLPQSYSSMQAIQQQNRRMSAARSSAAASPQLTPKPFSGYHQATTGVSPYLNLFRSGTNGGTIDNYTTLVRPELEQRRMNQQFGADIHGLENSSRVQGLNILRLDRDTQNVRGINATQYFMNYGDFYPNAGGQH
jgi:hypothetical protein